MDILRLKLYNSAIQLGDILEVGNQRHLLCTANDNPCLECSLDDLCDAMQETGPITLCNELDNVTFKDITQH